eukprot:gnl/Trimastix_PCT/3723.p1 GENE.gnl/Trimastix_PCT/3723~~gnl/Trimastix_PCT/3723.p1  ORF type:complete len:435 (-),score=-39.61 gnl/Trimastix_PCT/3723:46-1350(-)
MNSTKIVQAKDVHLIKTDTTQNEVEIHTQENISIKLTSPLKCDVIRSNSGDLILQEKDGIPGIKVGDNNSVSFRTTASLYEINAITRETHQPAIGLFDYQNAQYASGIGSAVFGTGAHLQFFSGNTGNNSIPIDDTHLVMDLEGATKNVSIGHPAGTKVFHRLDVNGSVKADGLTCPNITASENLFIKIDNSSTLNPGKLEVQDSNGEALMRIFERQTEAQQAAPICEIGNCNLNQAILRLAGGPLAGGDVQRVLEFSNRGSIDYQVTPNGKIHYLFKDIFVGQQEPRTLFTIGTETEMNNGIPYISTSGVIEGSRLIVDSIGEKSESQGVNVDGVIFKDGGITATAPVNANTTSVTCSILNANRLGGVLDCNDNEITGLVQTLRITTQAAIDTLLGSKFPGNSVMWIDNGTNKLKITYKDGSGSLQTIQLSPP